MKNQSEEPKPLIHPTMARRYRDEASTLTKALCGGKAREHVRGLIEKIVLTPKVSEDDLSIELYGDLAGILRVATEDNAMKIRKI